MRNWIRKFMERDKFSDALLIGALVCIVLNLLTGASLFGTIGFLMLVYGIFRIFSVDKRAREKENEKYMKFRSKILQKTGGRYSQSETRQRDVYQHPYEQEYEQPQKRTQSAGAGPKPGPVPRTDAKTGYVYFTCPTCRKTLRVPAGQGDITVHCPHCRYEFDTTT